MPINRRKFRRPIGKRRYKKLFIVAVEGIKTEQQYFNFIENLQSQFKLRCITVKKKSAPVYILKAMKRHLRENEIKSTDEAWIVVDKDNWHDEQLNQLNNWAKTDNNFGFALSNPKFEYWLLLHFEDGTGIGTSKDCTDRLKRYMPNYDKGIDANKLSREMIGDAIKRASQRDNPPCIDWPRRIGATTVYRLVQNVLR